MYCQEGAVLLQILVFTLLLLLKTASVSCLKIHLVGELTCWLDSWDIWCVQHNGKKWILCMYIRCSSWVKRVYSHEKANLAPVWKVRFKDFGYFSFHFPVIFFFIILNIDCKSLLKLRMQLVDTDWGHMKQTESFPSIKLFAEWVIRGNFIFWLSNAPL